MMDDEEKKVRRWIRKELICHAAIQRIEESMNVSENDTIEQRDAAMRPLDEYYNMEALE
jgi:hypothetical protein